MKIRLATVFSGIGAIEQAFKRLSIDHEIEFACDNGEVLIDVDTDKELEKIKQMESAENKMQYVNDLYSSKSRRQNFVKQAYLNNYKIKNDCFFNDAKLLDGTDFKGKVDLFVGGSPCQSFSIAGQRAGFEDIRGTLFYDYIRLVKEIKPEVFIYENVYGVLTHDNGKTWSIMKSFFDEIGYHFKFDILDARNYGIPQGRRRLFVVGFKNKESWGKFKFPTQKELKFTMQDFIFDNCAEGHFNYDKLGNIVLTKGGQKVDKFLSQKLIDYVMSPGTKNFYHEDAKIDLPIARAILSTQGNTHRASVNNYVTTEGKIRALEPRESLRLMGFPDSYKITVSRAQSYKQSGNSIVVDVLMALVKEIQKVVEEIGRASCRERV